MAEALLVRAVARTFDGDVTVRSAGFGPSGAPAEREVVEVMAEIGLDLSHHRSRTVDTGMLAEADLVLAMTRQHVMELVLLEESCWSKTFLLGEFASLAASMPLDASSSAVADSDGSAEVPGDSDLRRNVARLHMGRRRSDLLALPSNLEVGDPVGGPLRGYRATRDRIAALSDVGVAYLADAHSP
jgi:protein-tyrosine phosphatase